LTWGDNKYGTLGTGDRENCHTPTAVQALASLKIANIGCGSSHTIFITGTHHHSPCCVCVVRVVRVVRCVDL